MLEVLLGYITSLADIINYIIDAIQSLFSSDREEDNTQPPFDEEILKQHSLYN